MSSDGGVTSGLEMDSPSQLAGGVCSGTLRDGGSLKYLTTGTAFRGEALLHKSPMEGGFKDNWSTLHSTCAWFKDGVASYEVVPVKAYMPNAVTSKQTHIGLSSWPVFTMGKIVQLANGNLLAPMYGLFKGDTRSRVILYRSSDRDYTWRYHATAAPGTRDPNPEISGQNNGPYEPSIELLVNGQMIGVF